MGKEVWHSFPRQSSWCLASLSTTLQFILRRHWSTDTNFLHPFRETFRKWKPRKHFTGAKEVRTNGYALFMKLLRGAEPNFCQLHFSTEHRGLQNLYDSLPEPAWVENVKQSQEANTTSR